MSIRMTTGKRLAAILLLAVFASMAIAVPVMAASPMLGFYYSKTYGGYILSMNHYTTQYLVNILLKTGESEKQLELISKLTGMSVNYARILISMGAVIINTADKGNGVFIVFYDDRTFSVKSRE